MSVNLTERISKRDIFLIAAGLFVLKVFFAAFYVKLVSCSDPTFPHGLLYVFSGDSFSFTGAMENYIKQGEYYFVNLVGEKTYAGRLPHYSIPYYFLRLIFSKDASLDVITVLQILLEVIASLVVGWFVFSFSGRKFLFYLSILVCAISLYYLHFSTIPITDSPAASLFIISYYFLYKFLKENLSIDLILFSSIFGSVIVLRPYWSIFLILVFLYIVYAKKPAFKTFIIYGLNTFLPLLVLLLPWVVRNYHKLGRLIHFQQDIYAGYGVKSSEVLNRKLLTLIGEDATVGWDKYSAAGYFSIQTHQTSQWKVPSTIKQDSTLSNLFENYRQHYLSIQQNALPDSDNQTVGLAHEFMQRYKQKLQVQAYLLNPLKRLKLFLVQSGAALMPFNRLSPCYSGWQFPVKLFQALMYWLALIPGTLGLALLVRQKTDYLLMLLPIIYLVIMFPLLFGNVEWRYLLPFFYLHLIGLFYVIHRITRHGKAVAR